MAYSFELDQVPSTILILAQMIAIDSATVEERLNIIEGIQGSFPKADGPNKSQAVGRVLRDVVRMSDPKVDFEGYDERINLMHAIFFTWQDRLTKPLIRCISLADAQMYKKWLVQTQKFIGENSTDYTRNSLDDMLRMTSKHIDEGLKRNNITLVEKPEFGFCSSISVGGKVVASTRSIPSPEGASPRSQWYYITMSIDPRFEENTIMGIELPEPNKPGL